MEDLKPFDFIVASEVIYLEESFGALIETLTQFSNMNTIIVIEFKKHNKLQYKFFEMLEGRFSFVKESRDKLHENFQADLAFEIYKLTKLN